MEVLAGEGGEGGEVGVVARVRLAAAPLALPLEVVGVFCVFGELADLLVDEAALVGNPEFVVNGLLDPLDVLACSLRGVLVGGEDHGGELSVGESQLGLFVLGVLEFGLKASNPVPEVLLFFVV